MATTSEQKTAGGDTENLKEELAGLKADVTRLTDIIKKMSRDTAVHGRERAKRGAERAKTQVEETLDAFESEIGERPLISIVAAFGIGFVIGKLLDR